jgi:hypothetical protein
MGMKVGLDVRLTQRREGLCGSLLHKQSIPTLTQDILGPRQAPAVMRPNDTEHSKGGVQGAV